MTDEFAFAVRRYPRCDAILVPHELPTGALVDRCPACSQVVI